MKKEPKPHMLSFRPTDDDWSLIDKLEKKLGLGVTPIIRLALRRLWDAEQKQ